MSLYASAASQLTEIATYLSGLSSSWLGQRDYDVMHNEYHNCALPTAGSPAA